MKTATQMTQAFVRAAEKANEDNWIARQVADRVMHTNQGIRPLQDRFNLSPKTLRHINA